MSRKRKRAQKLLEGAVSDVRFTDLCQLLRQLKFEERIRGGHHIFTREGMIEILNLQPLPDGKAKPYQVRQVREIIRKYGLG